MLMSNRQRRKRLISLIEDEKLLNFNPLIIQNHELQLFAVSKEIESDLLKRKKFRSYLKEGKC